MKAAGLFQRGSILFTPLFLLMFAIACLLNVNFAVLRSMRSALTVADLGGSASLIPYFELLGTLPGSILITWFITWLMSKMPIQKVFLYTMGAFLSFYAIFAFAIYPLLPTAKVSILTLTWLPGSVFLAEWAVPFASMLFYAMAELWKVALFAILFWGLINQYLRYGEAKHFYAPLTLGNSIGAVVAGPLIAFCGSQTVARYFSVEQMTWKHSLGLLVVVICVIGIVCMVLYHYLWKMLANREETTIIYEPNKGSMTLTESFRTCRRSPYLLLMGFIVFADYVAYSLGELVFLDVVKISYPDPKAYCEFMGELSSWSGVIVSISALTITPWVMEKHRWVVSSLITPICLFITQTAFIFVVCGRDLWPVVKEAGVFNWVSMAVFLGSAQYVLCRGAKYTFFDASKELAFVHLPTTEKMQGKLIIDGIFARFGRGGASIISIIIIKMLGTPITSAWLAGLIAIGVTLGWIKATFALGDMVDGKQSWKSLDNNSLSRNA